MDKADSRLTARKRGAALPTVLALIFLVLVVGLAMGSLSILSLQFNRRQLDATRSELAARSAVAVFVSKLHAQDVEAGMDPLAPEPYRVVDRLGQDFTFEQDGYTAKLSFTSREYSSDNLGGDKPMIGSPDSDEIARVPPFTLDLVLRVEGPVGTSRYRVGLRRVWPYALYTKLGPIVLMGDPQPGEDSSNPTRLEGDAYTSWNGNAAGGGVTHSGYGLDPFATPFDALAYLEARSGLHPMQTPSWFLTVGEILGRNPALVADQVDETSPDTHYAFYAAHRVPAIPSANPGDPTFAPAGPSFVNGGNELNGDFVYAYEDGQEIELTPCVVPTPLDPTGSPSLGPEPTVANRFTGKSSQRRPLAVDPLGSRPGSSVFSSQSFQKVSGLSWAGSELQNRYGVTEIWADKRQLASGPAQRPWMLTEDLVLEGSHYVIDGSVTNRHVIYGQGTLGEGLYVREQRAGMRLQGTTLHVKGDLDLGAGSFAGPDDEERITLVGSAATLIVDGKLILGNATINAQDQGFMIFAKDIVLTGGGNFFGLMIAENSISILSRPDNPLNVQGALLCQGRGGIVLRGATVKHDPEYLKSLNQAGDFQIVSWKKLN